MAVITQGYIKGQPDASWWLSQIRSGIRYRKDMAHEPRWEAWRRYYRGQWPAGSLPVNLFYRMLRSTVPRIYFNNPSISIKATKPGLEQQALAQLVERMDNKLIRSMNMKKSMKRAIQHTWMFGTGALKLGIGAQFTPTPDEHETQAPEHVGARLSRKVEYNSQVEPNMPWVLPVHTGNLIVPDGLATFEETPWVANWIKRSWDDVVSDPRLKHVGHLNAGHSGPGFRKNPINPNMIDLVEIRDMRTGKVIIFAPYIGNDKVLYFEDDELQNHNRPNTYPLVFNEDDECFWGVPDSIILEPQQLELNEIRTLQMKHRRMSLLKLLYKNKAITEDQLTKLLDGEVLAGIRVDGELSDIDTIQVGEIPKDLFAAGQEVINDVKETLGFSRNQWGEYGGQKSHSAPTAYEAQVVNQASEIRIDERRDQVADVLVQIMEDCNELVFDRWTDEQVVQVLGPNKVPVWVAFKPDMLKAARYELNIDPDSAVPETKDVRRANAVKTYELLKTNPLIDPGLLTNYLVHELNGVDFDQMLRQMQAAAAAGMPGSTPSNPMQPGQFMEMLAAPQQPQG